MSPGGEGRSTGRVSRIGAGLQMLVVLAVLAVYANRAALDLPLYPATEGGYLIHALYGKALSAQPALFAQVERLNGTAYFLIIRAATYATHDLLPWMRVLGGLAYFAGLLLVYQSVRVHLQRGQALGFLLLALAFPYYRFAFAVLPEGWFVGVLGLIVLLTTRLYTPRPLLHAILAGALTGLLVMLKPQGLAVAAAFLVLAVLDLLLGRRDARILAGRILVFTAGFLVSGHLTALAANQPITSPFDFVTSALNSQVMAGAVALAPVASSMLIFAGVPALAGLVRIEMRWRWYRQHRRGFRLEPLEVGFLLVLLSLLATLATTGIGHGGGIAGRVWGRDLELFVPILWLTAAAFIGEFDRAGLRWWRVAMAIVPVVGVAGLVACLLNGAMLLPWDSAAASAFFRPDLTKFDLAPAVSYFALAIAAILAAAGAMAFTAGPSHRIWLTYVVAVAVLSTAVDIAWENSIEAKRAQLSVELRTAKAIMMKRRGGVAVVVDDRSTANTLFWGLQARPEVVLASPGQALAAPRLAQADTVIVSGRHRLDGTWTPVFQGKSLKVFSRAARPHPRADSGEALGSNAGSG
ncbi:hypothetical protein [Phenylobacterium sp. Root700]|uniref:hypothetical protein n=1 Tax=Phenylobacterium sp. Root700 TaxID=1736591 RepID=UPI000A45AA3F|nr:hypothetical protein [Phenylobacterium sp. Root700]